MPSQVTGLNCPATKEMNIRGFGRHPNGQARIPGDKQADCRRYRQRHRARPRLLMSHRINRSTTAPIVAVMIAAMMPRPR
jgi:hypothetical protein